MSKIDGLNNYMIYADREKTVCLGERVPSNAEIMDKINEIIIVVNELAEQLKEKKNEVQ